MRVVRCCVVGAPIRHSRSPFIHRLFAEQFGLALRYDKREVGPGALAGVVAELIGDGLRGINVTIPLKEEAWALATRRSPRAAAAGAANVLSFEPDAAIEADNTDGLGLVRDLAHHGVTLAGRRVLLLGAGGAARGIVPALLEAGVARLFIANRTPDKAAALAAAFATPGRVKTLALAARCPEPVDLVINSTSAGLTSAAPPPVPAGALGAGTACHDLVYGSGETPFLRWAREQGVKLRIDGLGMLVEQAAAAFARWHGLEPATLPVIEALRRRL
ncbi:MAG TPA: shikimate dehydrogenase [Gammaproteobacteria bacterium]|nr:shikimate dehydrogenase [Gammaproteobacteria bacterium]